MMISVKNNPFSKVRIISFIFSLLYVLAFHWSYVKWTVPQWGYLGMSIDKNLSVGNLISCYFANLLPAIWLPIIIDRPSKLMYWYLYLLMYVPMVFTASLSLSNSFLIYILLIGFGIMGIPYLFKVKKIKIKELKKRNFWVILFIIIIIFVFFILLIFRNNLRFVNPFSSGEEVYDFRFEGSDIAQGTGVTYPVMILSGALMPFVFIYGLVFKNKIAMLVSISIIILLYMTAANKSFILLLPLILMNYFLLKENSLYFGIKLQAILLCFILFFTTTQLYLDDEIKLILFVPASLFLFRTVSVSSWTESLYVPFFENHPLTYYSHIGIVGKFIKYPYDKPLGVVIGMNNGGEETSNFNANFFITDGISAMGFGGVIVIAIIAAFLFWITDIVSAKHNIIFTSVLLTGVTVNLMNISLFTVLLSGGWSFLIIMLAFSSAFKNKSLK